MPIAGLFHDARITLFILKGIYYYTDMNGTVRIPAVAGAFYPAGPEELQRMIAECGVGERVLMPGAVAHEDLALWYSAADVFCLASAKEGRANVLLEALACGTPVVATEVGGVPEAKAKVALNRIAHKMPFRVRMARRRPKL